MTSKATKKIPLPFLTGNFLAKERLPHAPKFLKFIGIAVFQIVCCWVGSEKFTTSQHQIVFLPARIIRAQSHDPRRRT